MQNRKTYGDVEFLFEKPQNFEGCVLLNGWHGIGECGFISMSHLVENLELKRIGFIITNNMPQFISIKNEQITFPFEIYRKENLVVILPIFEPIKPEHLLFTKTIVEWSIEEKFQQAVLIGGLDKRLQDEHAVKGIYTRSFKRDENTSAIPVLDEGLYVTGPLAYMLMFYELNQFPAIALLPYAERSRPDPVAASEAIKQINILLGVNIDTEGLLKEAEKIEKEIESLIKASKPKQDRDKDSDQGMFV